jgi:uncharacterized protein (TIGR02466 family)
MRVKRTDMFVSPVWEVELGFDDNFNQELLKELQQYYKDTGAESADSNIWSCHTPCIDTLNRTILAVVKELTYDMISVNYSKEGFEYLHTRGWLNYNRTGQGLPLHGHGGSKISATYYINAPENCGDLILVDPRGGVDWEKGMDGINGTKHNRITPTTGTLVFFPSFMLHSVDTNRNSQPRISLTTDISTLSPASIKYFSTLAKD